MKILDYSLRLLVVCVIASGLLAFVYENTSKRIEANNEKEKLIKVKEVLPKGVDRIKEEKIQDVFCYKAYKGDRITGYAITSSSKGYGGDINLLVGIDNFGKIINISVLSHKETPGLGAKIEERSFLDQFKNKIKTQVMLKKDDKKNGQIDAIAAATISSRAFTKAVKKAFDVFERVKNEK